METKDRLVMSLVKTREITLTIPQTPEINRKPQSATCHSVTMTAYKIGFLTIYGIRTSICRACEYEFLATWR
jgi:hypothetical protein